MQDVAFMPFLKTYGVFENWILSCTRMEQLYILNEIIEDFISKRRFPEETINSVNVAVMSLRIEIENQMKIIKSVA